MPFPIRKSSIWVTSKSLTSNMFVNVLKKDIELGKLVGLTHLHYFEPCALPDLDLD